MGEEKKIAYVIKDITEFGKLMAYCIERDICVFRTYWDEREKDRVYYVDFCDKRCFYSRRAYYEDKGYQIQEPIFSVNEYGIYEIKK